jgi:hypothetical protein
MEPKNQMGTESDSANKEPLQVRWNWKIKNNLYVFIPKSMGFSQPELRVPAVGDLIENIKTLTKIPIS